MDISVNAKVNCSDGPAGQCTSVIIQPNIKKITHLVVRGEKFLDNDYLISLDHVVESTPEKILLNCSQEELEKMPVFNTTEFIPSDVTGYTGGPYMMWPYYAPMAPYVTIEKEHIPADELVMRRGARVEATDGDVGRVDEFLINPTNDSISHLVMREGHFWDKKTITIPVSKIDHYEDDTVYLKMDKEEIGKLPSIPVQHSWTKNE
jgi:hypothetical protein